jgi:hypothetical protein
MVVVREDARSQISTTLLAAREKRTLRPQSRFPLFSGYCAVYPPSTMMSWPVVNAAPGELSQSTALAISSGVPMRPTGFCVAIVFFTSVSPSPKVRSNISVWIGPGETLLTRTHSLANSSAAVLVRPMRRTRWRRQTDAPGKPMCPPTEELLTMAPPPDRSMARIFKISSQGISVSFLSSADRMECPR